MTDELEKKVEEPGFLDIMEEQGGMVLRSIPKKEFIIAGILGAASKLSGGFGSHFVHEYGADFAATFGFYHFFKNQKTKTLGDRVAAALPFTLLCYYGELAQAVDFLPNPFVTHGANPYDLIAYTLGAGAAVGLDVIKERKNLGEGKNEL
jgi:hypothetical protein